MYDLSFDTTFSGYGRLLLHNITLSSQFLYRSDRLFLCLLLLALALLADRKLLAKPLALGESLQTRLHRYAPLLCAVVLGLLASYPLLTGYVLDGHDFNFHITRLQGLADGLRQGQFPVRVNPESLNGYGYAANMMYPDLFLWPFALLRLARVSVVSCYLALCVCTNVGAALAAYLAGSRMFRSRWSGLFTSLLYTFAMYRAINLYTRSAVGESIAMACAPLLALGLYEIVFGDARKWPIAFLGASGIVQSHVLSVIIYGILSLLFLLATIRRWKERVRLLALAKTVVLALAANLWFLLPFLYTSSRQLHIHLYGIGDLVENSLSPGSFFFQSQLPNIAGVPTFPAVPGLVLMLCGLAMAAGLLFYRPPVENRRCWAIGGSSLALAGLCLFAASKWFPWQALSHFDTLYRAINTIQFAWRLVGPACLFLALCGGALFACWVKPGKQLPAFAVTLALCLLAFGMYAEREYANGTLFPITRTFGVSHRDGIDAGYHFDYFYADTDGGALMKRPATVTAETGELRVEEFSKANAPLSFSYRAPQAQWLDLPLHWYPGYTTRDGEGNALAITRSGEGLVRVWLTAAEGNITVRYTGLWWFRIGDAVSLATLLGCGLWWLRHRRKLAPEPDPTPA